MNNHKQHYKTKLEKYMDEKTWYLFILSTVLLMEGIFFSIFPMGYGDIATKVKNVILISGVLYCMLIVIIVNRQRCKWEKVSE